VNALTPLEPRLAIEVVHDFVCPWCYLGMRRLMLALARRPSLPTQVTWRPFLLNPDMPAGGLSQSEYAIRKYGGEERARRLYATITELGRSDGVAFRFDRMSRVPSSVDAHRLANWAAHHGMADAMVEALFAAHFTEGADLGCLSTLASLAGQIGLSRAEAAAVLRSRAEAETVHGENLRAHRRGISGVPCMVVGGEFAVSGAQEPDIFLRLLDVACVEHPAEAAACSQ